MTTATSAAAITEMISIQSPLSILLWSSGGNHARSLLHVRHAFMPFGTRCFLHCGHHTNAIMLPTAFVLVSA
jgi:hypothetical protein